MQNMVNVDDILVQMNRNPKNVGLCDLCAVCDHYFGEARQKSDSHRIYKSPWQGDPRIHIQNSKKKTKAYQVKQGRSQYPDYSYYLRDHHIRYSNLAQIIRTQFTLRLDFSSVVKKTFRFADVLFFKKVLTIQTFFCYNHLCRRPYFGTYIGQAV
jgi:hypothetical protein